MRAGCAETELAELRENSIKPPALAKRLPCYSTGAFRLTLQENEAQLIEAFVPSCITVVEKTHTGRDLPHI